MAGHGSILKDYISSGWESRRMMALGRERDRKQFDELTTEKNPEGQVEGR